jgi:hypothetical protein
VLTGWYNDDQKNHIHFENGVAVLPIRRDERTDTTLVQATCKYMNGESIAIDGGAILTDIRDSGARVLAIQGGKGRSRHTV